MEKERANAYLEKLSRINPKLAHEYVVLLPTLYKPDSGTPYIWLIASENACALITTLSRKPLWQEFEYAYLNSVKLNNNILHILFEDYGNNPDILLPIDAKFISQACAARKFITQQIRKYKLME